MKWIGRVTLAVLSLFVLARAASAQPAYSVPPGYVKAANPQDYLPGYPAGGIPVEMGADGRYYAQAGGGQGGYEQGGYAQGGYSQGVAVSGCCGGAPQPYPPSYPVPQPVARPCGGPPPACGGYGYPGGYPAGGVVVVEETCCRGGGGGYPAPAPSPIPPGYVPIAQYVETVPCGGGCGGGYPPAPPPCCAAPAPPPSCDWSRPRHPQDPYACPPGWGEVRLNDSFFWGGGGVGPEYIPGGGGGGGYAYAGAGAGASAYASASASVRVSVGGRYGGGKPHRPKPRGGKCGCH